MSKFLIGAAATAAIAIPAIAQMHGGMDHAAMAGPVKRGDIEARVKEHFAMVDANRDGFATREEIAAMREKHMAEMRDKHFAAMDTNKDGSISRAEFDAAHAGHGMMGDTEEHQGHAGHGGQGAAKADRIKMMHMGMAGHRMGMMGMHGMARADKDGDGRVSLAEALTRPLERFDAADTNKDGTLTPEERKAAHEKRRAEWKAKRG